MTHTLVTLACILVPALVFGAVWIQARRRIAAMRRRMETLSEWNQELSLDGYRPMLRLLDENDIRFLKSQPGARPGLVRRLRRQRYQIFRGYLESLKRDFERGCDLLMVAAVQSHAERRDIIRALLVSRAKFSLALWRVHYRLVLYRWNIACVPVGHLVGLFEALQFELPLLSTTADGAQA
jgi:hypothetical protein